MSIGKILGALSPGLSATGLFGHQAQQGGMGALSAMSPLLALLLHHKQNASAPGATPAASPPAVPGPSPLTPPQPLAQATGPTLQQTMASMPQMDPNAAANALRRKQVGLNLMQLGPQFLGGSFGQRY